MWMVNSNVSLVLTLIPIVTIFCMLVVWKKSADISGMVGWFVVAVISYLFFKTSAEVILRSTAAGFIKSFPVSLIVLTSLLQMAYMEKTGALKRIIIFMKTIASENRAIQIMLINVGFGTLMVAVGATPVSLLPPILIAMGYSTYVAIALPAIGYDSLCTYALLGAPVVVFVDIANGFLAKTGQPPISLSDAGRVFFMFLPIVSSLIGFSMLWITGKWAAIKQGWLPCLITGTVIGIISYFTNRYDNFVTLTGIFCGLGVILTMIFYLYATGRKVIDKSKLSAEELAYEKSYPLWKALMPWVLLIVSIMVLNVPKSVFDFLYREALFSVQGIAADGSPIPTRALWNAYTWIFLSTVLSMLFIKPTPAQFKETLRVWGKRAPRPVFSAAIFFAIGELMNMSGFDMQSKAYAVKSMFTVLADYSAQTFHSAYGAVTPFIGLLGGFITGSESSTIGMFAKYTLATGSNLEMDVHGLILITAALAFGGGLASVISPAKLQNAAASIDKLGEENQIIRVAFLFSIGLTFLTAVLGYVLLITGLRF